MKSSPMNDKSSQVILVSKVEMDTHTEYLSKYFDYAFTGESSFILPPFTCPTEFNIGLIVGSSGSGKTQILKHYFDYTDEELVWNPKQAIVSHFETPEIAVKKLMACGLSSIPSLCRPHHVLSNGEQFRANMARKLSSNIIVDEYTSVVNRETAISLSIALEKYIRKHNLKNIVISSVHRDIIEWLQPDWIFDTDMLTLNNYEIEQNKKRVAKIEIE